MLAFTKRLSSSPSTNHVETLGMLESLHIKDYVTYNTNSFGE